MSVRLVLALIRYHLLSIWNWRSIHYGRLVEPVAYLVFLIAGVSGLAAGAAQREAYLLFVVPGFVVFVAFRGWDATVVDVANDKKWGVYALSRIHGTPAAGYLASIILVGLTVFLVQFCLVIAVAAGVLGVRGLDSPRMLAATALVAVTWIAVGCAVGALVNSYHRRDLITRLTALPVVLSAPLLYSLENAPPYLRVLAHFNPLTYQVGWVREVVAGQVSGYPPLAAAAVAALVMALISLRSVDWLSNER